MAVRILREKEWWGFKSPICMHIIESLINDATVLLINRLPRNIDEKKMREIFERKIRCKSRKEETQEYNKIIRNTPATVWRSLSLTARLPL